MIQLLEHKNIAIAQQIHRVFQVSYAIEAELLGAVGFFPPLDRSVEQLQQSITSFYGFWKGGELTAVMELEQQKVSNHICSLVVDPRFFRQGIARSFLEFSKDSSLSSSEILTVETGLANHPACSLYKNFGFKEEKRYMTSIGIEKIRFTMDLHPL